MDYQLLDTGNLQKLEKFGDVTLIRPCLQAIWKISNPNEWKKADFIFLRDEKNRWIKKTNKKDTWDIHLDGVKLKLKLTDFGHIGFFPEHLYLCDKLESFIKKSKKKLNILNLFAYTGLVTMFALKNGSKVCHVDSSKPTIAHAKQNFELNNFSKEDIRWIFDDVLKFIKRELKRGIKYDGIVLDPPSFGRGVKNEVFKIEKDIFELLNICKNLLKDKSSFIIFSCHTPGFTKTVLENFFLDTFPSSKNDFIIDELLINPKKGYSLPSGYFVIR